MPMPGTTADHTTTSSSHGLHGGDVRRVAAYLKQRPDLVPRYRRAKQIRRVIRKSHNYDLTSRCNLFCEGCFYFEGDDYKHAAEVEDAERWARFFRAQAEAGVTFGFFAGAEPALVQERLVQAAEHIPRGSINSNGTIRIRPDLPYSTALFAEHRGLLRLARHLRPVCPGVPLDTDPEWSPTAESLSRP